MDDLLGPEEIPQRNIAEYTVSELSFALKRTVEDTFSYVRVRGELGRISKPASGHIYLDLKDDKAVMAGVIWRGNAAKLKVAPEQGLEVIATGKLTTYPGQSKYQIVIESIEPAGAGALMALLEERKKKLQAEGLFDEARKKPLPFLPRIIGIVTSPSGAVIRDMMHGFNERFPARVLVWPVRVQGETCAKEVAAAIEGFNALKENGPVPRPDVLIVARGGGSLEDLWGFNEEIVARAVAASDIPLISAIGHETDWTLIDYVADARAPTPTKAAEWAVPKYSELLERVSDHAGRLSLLMRRYLETKRSNYSAAARGLPRLQDLVALPRQRFDTAAMRLGRGLIANTNAHHTRFVRLSGKLEPALRQSSHAFRLAFNRAGARLSLSTIRHRQAQGRQRLDNLSHNMARAFSNAVLSRRRALTSHEKLLASLSYHNVLARGFALVRDEAGQMVRGAQLLQGGQAVEIEFADGSVGAQIMDTGGSGERPRTSKQAAAARSASPRKKGRARASEEDGGDQGSFF